MTIKGKIVPLPISSNKKTVIHEFIKDIEVMPIVLTFIIKLKFEILLLLNQINFYTEKHKRISLIISSR